MKLALMIKSYLVFCLFITFEFIALGESTSESFIDALSSVPHGDVNIVKYNNGINELRKFEKKAFGKQKRVIGVAINVAECYKEGNLTEACKLIYELEASGDVEKAEDSLIIHAAFSRLYLDVSDYSSAKFCLSKCVEIQMRLGLTSSIIYSWFVEYYYSIEEFENAIFYLKLISRSEGNSRVASYLNIGNTYNLLNDFDSSRFYLNLSLSDTINYKYDKTDLRFIYMGLGDISFLKKRYKEALSFYGKVIKDTLDMGNWYPYLNSYFSLIESHCRLGNLDSCKYYLDHLELCTCLNFDQKIQFNSLILGYYKRFENHPKVLIYQEKVSNYRDSLISRLKTKNELINILKKEQLQLVKRNFDLIHGKNIVIREKNSTLLYLIILLLIAFCLIFIFFHLLVKRKKKINQLTRDALKMKIDKVQMENELLVLEVKDKTKDLISFSTNLQMKRHFFNDRLEKLGKLIDLDSDLLKKKLKEQMSEFRLYSNIDVRWEAVHSDVQNVNSEIFRKIGEKHSMLTQSDIDICGLHLSGISTKDIAFLRNVTPKAIQVSRYRIKKKLGLSEKQDLVEYLKSQM